VLLDLNERLPAITGLLRRSLGEAIRLDVHHAVDLWPALIDPTQVDDALVNLAINARDAMPEGGSLIIETANVVLDEDYATHHVEVSPGEYVMLAVSDSGTGMSSDVIARAFEPFFTTKPEGKGTGLGLSQVYGWVKQSGGHIKVYSELGHGTTIKLYLPRAAAVAGDLPSGSRRAGSAPRGSETIFVVEDNPNVRSIVLRQLTDLGYVTIEAADGASAVEMARQGAEFDMLLTDVVMPGGMTGYDVAERLAALRPDLKVLFTSGYTQLAAGNGRAARAGPLLSKPYRKQDLGRAVRALLDS
jgi:CheY-like chemotaxis protein